MYRFIVNPPDIVRNYIRGILSLKFAFKYNCIIAAGKTGIIQKCDQACKPSSVVNSHLSGLGVTAAAHATSTGHAGPTHLSLCGVAPNRVCRAVQFPARW